MSTTADRQYTTQDKSEWGRGPWQDEPDKLQWVDQTTGLDCLVVRSNLGALCGYVGVPSEHPWHGIDYCGRADGQPTDPDDYMDDWESRIDSRIEAHGGLTYSAACQEGETESEGICHVPLPGRPADVWWLGFDTAHSGDLVPGMHARGLEFGDETYRTVGYVQRECARLAEQLAAVA